MEIEEFKYGGWKGFILISEGKKKWGWQNLVRAQNGSRDACIMYKLEIFLGVSYEGFE